MFLNLPSSQHSSCPKALTPLAGRQTIHNYDPKHYKCTGSVVSWALSHKFHDAFVVWLLAQQYDRSKHSGKTTGRITSPFFVDWLAKTMAVEKRTAQKRLEKALNIGFLDHLVRGYTITGHRRMVKIAMDDQARRHADGNNIDPRSFLDADREFTRTLDKWIVPTDMKATAALLSGRAMQQGTVLGRGRKRLGKLSGCHARTMIRRTEKADVIAQDRYIRLEPMKMLVDASCGPQDAIKAFVDAEAKFRKLGGNLPGRQFLHSKHIMSHCSSFLVIQIANSYYCKSDVKEVPARFTRHSWIRKSGLANARRPIETTGHHLRPSKPHQYTTWKTGAFVKSRSWGDDHVPENVLHVVLQYVQDIVDNLECADLIMTKTGASGIRSVYAASPRGWKERPSGVTPSLGSATVSGYSILS